MTVEDTDNTSKDGSFTSGTGTPAKKEKKDLSKIAIGIAVTVLAVAVYAIVA